MTASSYYTYDPGYNPHYGRLNSNRGVSWCTQEGRRSDDWLEVDLGKTTEVCGVATQGNNDDLDDYPAWVKKFKLSYSSDRSSWTTYSYQGSQMVSLVISVYKLTTSRLSITSLFKDCTVSESINPLLPGLFWSF